MRYAFYVIISLILTSCYVLDNPFDPDGSNYRSGDGQISSTTSTVVDNGSSTTVPESTTTTSIVTTTTTSVATTSTSTSSTSTTTTVPFGTGRHEAEANGVALAGGSPVVRAVTGLDAGYSGYSGDGYVESFYPVASVTFTVDISVANTYSVQIRYAAGPSKALRDTNLYVNGALVGLVQFAVTANWWTWEDLVVPMDLIQGTNTIEFKNEFTNEDLVNFDYIQIP